MQKFDRFMLQILNQVYEEKKAARELDRYAREMYRKKNTYVEETFQSVKNVPVYEVKKIDKRGYVIAENGIRLHASPSANDDAYKEKKGKCEKIYKLLTQVKVIHEEIDDKGWYRIKTDDNQYGFIEKRYIQIIPENKVLDDYTRTLLYVKTGYNFESNIANYFFSDYQYKTGNDRRTLAEAFYLLNKESKHKHGIYLEESKLSKLDKLDRDFKLNADPTFHNARTLYNKIKLSPGRIVRIPNQAYIDLQEKKGTLSSRPEFMNDMISLGRAHQGFIEGLWAGIYDETKSLVVGIWDLIKGIFTGELFANLWEFIKTIWEKGAWEGLLKPMLEALGKSWNTFWKKFNSGNPRLQAYLIGDLIGRLIFNIVLAILTAGATVYLAATARGAALLAKFPKITKLVHKAIDAIPKSQRNLIQKALKDKAGNVLYESNRRIVANELRREINSFARRQVRKKVKKKIVKALKKLVILSRFQLIKLFKLKDEVLDLLKRLGIAIRADIDNLDPSRQLVISGGYFEVMFNGQQLFSATREELSKFFDNIKKINDNAGFAETKKMLQSIQKTANPKTVREVIENYAKKSGTSKKTSKLLKDVLAKGDEIALNAAEVYTQNANIRNRVILGKGALEKVFNKPVVSAYIERFKKYDILDINGDKIDINPSNESQIKELFEGKYALYYKGKMRELSFEAHHIVPKELLLDPDLRELHIFVKNNKDKFDFNGLDNGIPVHKYSKEFKDLGGHGNHPDYSKLTKKRIEEIRENSFIDGDFNQKIFEAKLFKHINDTRNDIVKQVIEESKKINNLIFSTK